MVMIGVVCVFFVPRIGYGAGPGRFPRRGGDLGRPALLDSRLRGNDEAMRSGNDGRGWDGWYREIVETEIQPLLEEYWFDDLGKADEEVEKLLEGVV